MQDILNYSAPPQPAGGSYSYGYQQPNRAQDGSSGTGFPPYTNTGTNLNAPFGNSYTPVLRQKVIAGKYRNMLESGDGIMIPPAPAQNNAQGPYPGHEVSEGGAVLGFSRRQHHSPRRNQAPSFASIFPNDSKNSDSENYILTRRSPNHLIERVSPFQPLPPIPGAHPGSWQGPPAQLTPRQSSRPSQFPPQPPYETHAIPPDSVRAPLPSQVSAWNDRRLAAYKSSVLPIGFGVAGGSTPRSIAQGADQGAMPFRYQVADAEIARLYALLPSSSFLTSAPIQLSEGHERALDAELERAFREVERGGGAFEDVLRRVYAAVVAQDPDASKGGYIPFHNLNSIFALNQLYLPAQLLRLLACMFVVGTDGQRVNYEKLLGFLALSFRRLISDPLASKLLGPTPSGRGRDRGTLRDTTYSSMFPDWAMLPARSGINPYPKTIYSKPKPANMSEIDERVIGNGNWQGLPPSADESYGQRPPTAGPKEPEPDNDMSRIQQWAQEQVAERGFLSPAAFEGMRVAFQRADKHFRGVLSLQQIKDLCQAHNVPLNSWLIEQIVRKCTDRGYGQYDWLQFVGYLERLVPTSTGMDVNSIRPGPAHLPPEPLSSWPHADTGILQPPIEESATARQYYKPKTAGSSRSSSQSDSSKPPYTQPSAPRQLQNGDPRIYSDQRSGLALYAPGASSSPYQNYQGSPALAPIANPAYTNGFPPTVAAGPTPAMDGLANSGAYFPSAPPPMPPMEQPPPAPAAVQSVSSDQVTTSEGQPVTRSSPWPDRFMALAKRLYARDPNKTGSVNVREAAQISRECNDELRLGYADLDLEHLQRLCRASDGRLDVERYLKELTRLRSYFK